MTSLNSDISHADIVKGNSLVRTHVYAAFLRYNNSWSEAIEVYRKASMYREAILMTLMYLLVDSSPKEKLIRMTQDLFRNWGDQVAAEDGDGRLVSMW